MTALTTDQRQACIIKIRNLPGDLERAILNLTTDRFLLVCPPEHPTLDGDWNIAQTIHHLADSHIHAYVRIKLILTEDRPTLKTWDQQSWAEFDDAKQTDVAASLSLLRGLHSRWSTLLAQLKPADFARVGIHPDMGELSIDHFVKTYARHGHGHIGQIQIALGCAL